MSTDGVERIATKHSPHPPPPDKPMPADEIARASPFRKRLPLVILSTVIVLVIAGVAIYSFLPPSPPYVLRLKWTAEKDENFTVEEFAVKLISVTTPSANTQHRPSHSGKAHLQWRCTTMCTSNVPLTAVIYAEFYDNNGFLIDKRMVDDKTERFRQGELTRALNLDSRRTTFFYDFDLDLADVDRIASVRLWVYETPDYDVVLARLQAELDKQEEPTAGTAKQTRQPMTPQPAVADAEVAKFDPDAWLAKQNWSQVNKGLSRPQIEKLLGKPHKVTSFGSAGEWWYYPSLPGKSQPHVKFGADGKVDGWQLP